MPYLCEVSGKKRWRACVVVVKNGKKFKKTKLFPDRSFYTERQARNWEDYNRNKIRTQSPLIVCDLVERYLSYAVSQYLNKTYKAKHRALGRFLGFYGSMEVSKVDTDICLQHLQKQAISRGGNAANRDRKEMGAAWEWAREYLAKRYTLRFNPWHDVKKWKCQQNDKYIPPIADFDKILEVANRQDYVMLTTFKHTAGRLSEILKLKWNDIDLENRMIRMWTRKRNNGNLEFDWIPMTKELRKILVSWHDDQLLLADGSKYVFINPRSNDRYRSRSKMMRSLCDRAGVARFSFHAIRHMAARHMYRNGAPFDAIQTLLRHKNPRTTAIYLQKIGLENSRFFMDKLL